MWEHHPKQTCCKEEKEFLGEESWVWNWYPVLILAYCGLALCGSGQVQPGLLLACFGQGN